MLDFEGSDVQSFALDVAARRLTIQLHKAVLRGEKGISLGAGELVLSDWESFQVQSFDGTLKQWQTGDPKQARNLRDVYLDGESLTPDRSLLHGTDPATGLITAYLFTKAKLAASFEMRQ